MASFKLCIFLLLVAAVVTLGSPLTERVKLEDQNDEEMEDQDYEHGDQPSGSVIKDTELTRGVLNELLEDLGSIERKIAIGVENHSGYKWTAINTFFRTGTSNGRMPVSVATGEAYLYNGRMNSRRHTGVAGVMTYYIDEPGFEQTLAVFFKIPYDYNPYNSYNWWDVKMYDGRREADHEMYDKMSTDDPFEGDSEFHHRRLRSDLEFKGRMTREGAATLQIEVYNRKEHEQNRPRY